MIERKFSSWTTEEVKRVEKELSSDLEALNNELELLKKDAAATESALKMVRNIIKPEVIKNEG